MLVLWLLLVLSNALVRADSVIDPHMKIIPVCITNWKHLKLEILTCFQLRTHSLGLVRPVLSHALISPSVQPLPSPRRLVLSG